MRFDGLRRLSGALEVLAWLTVVVGVGLAVLAFGERDPIPQVVAGAAIAGSGVLLALLAQSVRALVFIANMLEEERNALPLPGGGRAPGVVSEILYGKEIRYIGRGRYWTEGVVCAGKLAAEDIVRADRKP